MNYFLLITDSKGDTRLVPVTDIKNVKVNPGDDVVVMDESGKPVDVSLRPDGENLIVEFEDGVQAVLEDFYGQDSGATPITISLNPVEPVSDAYEFNSQTGNLPNAKSFTLMRFSNTEYVEFVEQIDELNRSLLPLGVGQARTGGLGGGSNIDEPLPLEETECCNEPDPAPAARADAGSGTAGGPPILIDLLANDVDPLGGGLNIHSIAGIGVAPGGSVTLPSGSIVTVAGGGEISVQPGSGFDSLQLGESGTETFIYSLIDSGGRIATSEVTVTVNGVNDPPVAVEDEYRLNEDAPVTVSVLDNDSDPDASDTLTVTGISSPPAGNVTVNGDNTITYDPAGAFENLALGETATVTLTYVISDDAGATASSTVTFVVEGRNDAPDAIDDSRTVVQGSPLVIDVLANDIDPDTSDTLTVTGVTQPARGLVLHNEGDVTFDPGSEFDYLDDGESETVTFDYTISDGNGGTDTATVTVTVTGVEDPTVTAPDADVTDENTPVVVDVLANDTDLDSNDIPLTVTGVTQPPAGQGSVAISNGGADVTFTPGTDFDDLAVGESETVTFTYTTDTGATETVTITVNGLNDAPTAVDDNDTTDQNTAITIDAVDNDTDPDTSDDLIIIGVDQPGKGSVTINSNNQLVFDPGTDFQDLDATEFETVTFDYAISDGNGGTDTATVTITVTGVEDPTVTAPDADVTDENTPVVVDVLANDTDLDSNDIPLTVTGVTQPPAGQGSVAISNGGADVTFTPGTDFDDLAVGESETVTFTYTTDTGATETVTITVNGLNDAPTAVNDAGSVDEDATLLVSAANGVIETNDTDLDASDLLEVSAIRTGPESGTGTGALVGNPLVGTYGTLILNSDGSYSYAADQDAADPLEVGATVTDTFTYTLSDGNGGTDTAELVITVIGTNDAPLPNPPGGTPGVDPGVYDDEDTIAEDAPSPATGNVLANDIDPDIGDSLEVSEVNGVAGNVDNPVVGTYGTVTIDQDGSYSYALDNTNPVVQALAVGETTTETFSYTAVDEHGAEATATLTITITGTNDAPLPNPPGGTPGVDFGVYDDNNSIAEDEFPNSVIGNVLSNDRDPDGDTLTVSEVDGASGNLGSQVDGTYGTVTINSDGSYNYVLDNSNPAIQALGVGATTTDSFTYTADDGNGGTATATLTITITGTNDAPLPNPPGGTPGVDFGVYDDENSVAEDAPAPITGDVLANDRDPDTGDVLQVSEVNGVAGNVDNPVVGTYGTVTIDQDGSYSYALDNTNPVVQALAVGETTTETFTYTADDSHGGSATATLTITITGTNDAPLPNPPGGTPGVDFGVYDDENSIAEETVVPLTGDVLANDLDPDGDTLTVGAVNGVPGNVASPVTGTYGTVTIDEDGSYRYLLDNSNPTVQALGVGQSTTETFTYTADDGNGGTATATLTITITGTNDAPVAVDDSGSGDEDMSISGNVVTNDTDVDGDTPLTVVSNTTPAHGTLVIAPDGSYTYTPDPDYNGLDSFTYTIEDPSGASDTATVTLTINPANDPPIAVDDSDNTDENTAVTIDVLDNDTDIEGDTLTVTSIDDSTLTGGTATLNGNNTVTFDPGTGFDSLAVGETATETLTYVVEDGNGGSDTATVTITIEGTNDGPTAVNDAGSVNEDATLVVNAANGVIQTNDTDPDGTDVLEVSAIRTGPESGSGTGALVGNPLVGTYGTLTLNEDGSYSYTADQDAADPLAVGVTATDTFTYEISDGNGGTDTAELVITVTGTNDGPLPNPPGGTPGVDPGVYDDEDTIAEDAPAPVTGNVLDNDVDLDIGDTFEVSEVNGATGNVDNPVAGTYGSVTIDQDGRYSYALDNTNPVVQALAVGESTTDTFTYTADDGNGGTATATLTITITGTNDAPLPNPPGGTPGVDFGVYDDNNSIAEDEFPNSVIGNVLSNDLDPDGDTLTVSEVDGASGNLGSQVDGTYGTVTINSDGSYNYVLDNSNPAIQALGVGATTTDSFTYTADDGNGGTATATLTITITGTNDAPLPNPPGGTPGVDFGVYDDENSVAEDAPAPITGDVLANDRDPDTGDVLQVSEVNGVAGNVDNPVVGTYGTVTIDQDGSYSYALDNTNPVVQALAVGETTTETFTYTADDSHGGSATATLTITITGTNDAPLPNPPGGTPGVDFGVYDDENSIAEETVVPLTGDVLANDLDPDGDTLTVGAVNGVPGNVASPVTGTYGTVTIDEDGSYRYLLDNSNPTVQALGVGQSTTETFTYTADDGNGGTATATLTITITGTNDAPVAVDDSGSGDEDMSISGNVVTNDTDVDGDTPLTVVSNTTPAHGTLVIAPDGSYTYTPDPDYNGLDSFTYTIEDPSGASDTATVTLTINPDNDPPIAVDDSASTRENSDVTIAVLPNDSDVDGDSLTVTSIDDSALTGGSATLNGNNTITFDPGTDFDSLAVGESTTETLTYVVNDGNGGSDTATVTITVNGVNDAPTAVDDNDTTDQNTAITIDATDNDTDPDTSDDLIIIGVDQPGKGSVTIDSNNQLVFDPGTDFQDLDATESETVTFDYTISDGNGGTDTATVTVTVTGVEDPTVTAPDADVTDENTPIVVDVLANDTDLDSNDIPLTVTGVTQPPAGQGSVAISNGGADVTFTPGTDFDDLAVGESETVTFTYTTDTGATETVTITVNGLNDAPVAIDDNETTDQDSIVNIDLIGAADSVGPDTDADGSDVLTVTQINGIAAGGTITLPSGALVTVNGNGTVDYDPNGKFDDLDDGDETTDSFTYVISDGNGGTDTATATVTISGVDDAMVTNPDADVTDEGAAVTIDVLANDSDVDGDDTLSVDSVSQPTDTDDGVVAVSNGGADVTFTPGINFESLAVGESATTSFTYTAIAAGSGETVVETVVVTVNGLNDAPDAVDDDETTDQNTAITIDALANDTDPDANNSLFITGVTQPTKGSVTYNVGNVSFDPGNDFDDLDVGESETITFTYDITDGNGGNDTATITVTVTGTEDATVTAPDADVTTENSSVVIDVLANDTDPDTNDMPLTVTGITQPPAGEGSVAISNGGADVTFNPGTDYDELAVGESATTSFTYTTDTGATETVVVTINGLNDAPTAVDDSDTTDQDTSIVIDAVSNDLDPDLSDSLIITSVNQPAKGSVTIDANNRILFNPGNDFDDLDDSESETVTFDYAISDGNGGTDTATVTVTVTGTDDATVTAPDRAVTSESSPVAIDVLANDTDPDTNDNPLSVAGVSQPVDSDDGSVAFTSTGVTFTPGSNFNSLAVGESGTTTFTYTTDTGSTETVTVTVTGENDAPTAADDSDSTNQGVPVTVSVLGNDTDPDTTDALEITGVTQPTKGSVTYNAGNLTFNPGNEFNDLGALESETVTFTYDISDGNGGTDTATVTITVNGTDDPTVTAPDSGRTDENSSIVVDVLANDTDPDPSDLPLTVTGVSQPPAGQGSASISGGGANVTFNPGTDFDYLAVGESATTSFTYTTDTGATENVVITVEGRNDGPTAVDDLRTTDQDTSIIITAAGNDTDPDTSDSLTITSVDQPTLGSASIDANNRIVFNPGGDFDYLDDLESTTVTFNYTISDGHGGTDTATITVTVTGNEDPANTNPDQGTTFEGSPVTINVISNDSDPDTSDNPLSVAAVTQPVDTDDGTVTFAGDNVTFTPGSNFDSLSPGQSATTTFQYETSTGETETVTITVNGLNSPTVTNPDADVTDEDTPIDIDVLANDDDPDTVDNPLTIQLVTQPNNPNDGTVINNGTDVTFTPGTSFDSLGPGDSATTTFTYTTDTGQTETVVVTVTGINDAPVANDDFVVSTTDIDPVTINVASNDTDVDGTLDLTSIDLDPTTAGQQTSLVVSGEGTWTVGGGGNVTFTPDPGITDQPSTITYSIADNDGATSTASLDLRYSAADVWFGNDESGSVNSTDFNQSRNLISGAAQQMSFATGDLAFNAALFTWADSSSQQMELGITANQTQFVSDSSTYSRNYSGGTDIGAGIVFGTQQIQNHVAAMQTSSDPRADVPQVMVILTDAFDSQILNDSSLLADAQAARNAGIILVFVAIQEAQENPIAVARLQQAASLDQNNDPLVITASSYADIDAGSIADLLNAIREAAAAGLLPPIVIDMDGDGVEFDDIENGILLDVDEDGVQERVAWADEDDAVLVYDENGNNDIDGMHEISFARYADKLGATDLDGLRHFDSNDDLILDANDAEFESFKLWQDKNGDGIVDEGEMQTLTEAGIESLELISDGQGYYTAGGDVQVHGEAAVNYADGTKGTLADSTFEYEEIAGEGEQLEITDGGNELEILTENGEILDVNDSGAVAEPATPELLHEAPTSAGGNSNPEITEGGAMPGTSAEDDMAAADAAMS